MAAVALATVTALAAGAAVAHDRAPSGKGVFIRSVKHCGDPDDCAAFARDLGLRWVTILLAWQYNDRPTKVHLTSRTAAYAKAFRRAGVTVWLWAWPAPRKAWELVSLYQRARALGVRPEGLILDPEAPYYARALADQALADVRELERLNIPLGTTSYGGGPPHHPSFPWAPFVSVSNFGIPQIYDSKHRLGDGYPTDAMQAWHEAGFRTLIPAWGASDAHTPEQMRDIIARTPPVYKACCWWDLYWLKLNKKRAQVVADMQLPKAARLA